MKSPKRFMSWRELVLSPLALLLVWGSSLWATVAFYKRFPDVFAAFLVYIVVLTLLTLIILKIMRLFKPVRPGVYSFQKDAWTTYIWGLYSMGCFVNLGLFYNSPLIPPPFRKFFYQLLGCKLGKGVISIGGTIRDPHYVIIEEEAMIGDEALILPHAITSDTEDKLLIGEIVIKRRAIIGARAMIMPGVTVGENAVVKAMSYVKMNTNIPDGEIWGGNPAVKIG